MRALSAHQYRALWALVRLNESGHYPVEPATEGAASLEGRDLTARTPDGGIAATALGHTALRVYEAVHMGWTP